MADNDIQDLIVIRRRSFSESEGVKGGVWKIAFADFMTAMMCFFLVMWLINAANEDTRKAVASYFNPLRLSELNRKGLADPHSSDENAAQAGERTTDDSKPGASPPADPLPSYTRDALFKDPYGVLSEIAGDEKGGGAAGEGTAAGERTAPGPGGQGFRDPFETEVEKGQPPAAKPGDENGDGDRPAAGESAGGQAPSLIIDAPPEPIASSVPAIPHGSDFPMSSPGGDAPAPLARIVAPPTPDLSAASPAAHPSEAESLGSEIATAVGNEAAGERGPKVAVESTGEGVLISLTDDVDFGMFAIGSAEPQPQMIRVMQQIAEILKARKGSITIRGHTDARPFRSAIYDNWRLSTDRAQMAYYMLVRGGLEEHRVAAIEGYADRKPKVPEDPEAAENRRIEILLREDTL